MKPALRLRRSPRKHSPVFLPFQTPLPFSAATAFETATQTERITHYTLLRKVVCQRVPLWKPRPACHGFACSRWAQKRDYQLTADSPSFVVTFRLPTAQSECSSILPYWVSALRRPLFSVRRSDPRPTPEGRRQHRRIVPPGRGGADGHAFSFAVKSAMASEILICWGQTASQLRQPRQAGGRLSSGSADRAIGARNPPSVKQCSL